MLDYTDSGKYMHSRFVNRPQVTNQNNYFLFNVEYKDFASTLVLDDPITRVSHPSKFFWSRLLTVLLGAQVFLGAVAFPSVGNQG